MFRALFSILVIFAVLYGVYTLYEEKELPLVGGTLGEAKALASAKAALALHRDLSDRPITVKVDGTERSIGQKLDDAAVGAKVMAALALHKDLKDIDLGIRVRGGTVYLEGEVKSPAQAETARRRVLTVDGVERVESFLRVPEAEESAGELAARIEAALTGNENLSPYRLRATLRNGTLVLEGEVATGAERDLAGMLAERVTGDRKLANEIQVKK